MFVAGIDAHTTYSVIVVVSNAGELVCKPTRIPNSEPDRLVKLLEEFRPVEVVVETGACAQPFIITGVNILEPPGVVIWSVIVVVLIVHGPCSIDMRMPP